MLQLAYVSRASNTLAPDDVFKIIETSARNNSRDDLTGFLIFAENRFFQVVEGSRSAIDALLSRLGEDTRHSQIEILSQTEIAQRAFPNWRMKRLKPDTRIGAPIGEAPGLDHFPTHLKHLVRQFLAASQPATEAA